jgi:hypothetical protein
VNQTEFEAAIIAPKDKVIVRIEKGDSRLSFNIQDVRVGVVVKVGSECAESTKRGVGGAAHFGQYNAELPFDIGGCGYLVMAEENIHAILGVN